MEPKEKAKELLDKFKVPLLNENKRLALIAVDELLNRDRQWIEKLSKEMPDRWSMDDLKKSMNMFEEVKEQIQNQD